MRPSKGKSISTSSFFPIQFDDGIGHRILQLQPFDKAMKFIIPLTVIALASSAAIAAPAAQPPAPVAPFAFKGAALGDELAAWRSKGVPAQGDAELLPLCVGDEGAPKIDRRSSAQVAAGVAECGFTKHENYNSWNGGRIGDFEYTAADHYFLQGKLYRIEVVAVRDAEAEMVRLLTAKYGSPKVESAAGSNGLGASIAVTRYLWASQAGKMILTSPDLRIDRLTLTLSDNAGEAEVAKVDQQRSPDADRI